MTSAAMTWHHDQEHRDEALNAVASGAQKIPGHRSFAGTSCAAVVMATADPAAAASSARLAAAHTPVSASAAAAAANGRITGQAPLVSASAGRALQPARSALAAAVTLRPPRPGLHRPALFRPPSSRAAGELAGIGLDRRFLPTDSARGVQFGFGRALVGSAPTQPFPGSVAVNAKTGTIYVANGYDPDSGLRGGDTVTVIDGSRCQARDVSRCKGPWPVVKVGDLPSTLAVDEATDTIYVTNIGDNTGSVINGATCHAHVISGCDQTPATVPVGPPSPGSSPTKPTTPSMSPTPTSESARARSR